MPQATIDYIIISLLLIGFIFGFKSGFIQKVFSFAGFIIAILGAFTFSPRVRPFLVQYFDLIPSTAVIVSFILVFLIIILITKLIINFIRPKKISLGFY